MRLACLITVSIVTLSLTQVAIAEYKSRSLFTKNYKCVVHESGGYSHANHRHELTRFSEREEYFLTHISRLPLAAAKGLAGSEPGDLNGDESLLRRRVEERWFTSEDFLGVFQTEKRAYFLRESSEDPFSVNTSKSNCEASMPKQEGYASTITCTMNTSGKFEFYPETGRFMISDPGSWASETSENSASSFFSFGTCKEYYN
ncbi:hypothetical protein [Stutzerimonas stutzeri]|uniref:hypothetical protein n=1 Tax=Stutzerimonas stutzeri TaxID=316 RepID=UPI001116AA7B|nr:hypothetical protein [Stutzerimonas stutzeri]